MFSLFCFQLRQKSAFEHNFKLYFTTVYCTLKNIHLKNCILRIKNNTKILVSRNSIEVITIINQANYAELSKTAGFWIDLKLYD